MPRWLYSLLLYCALPFAALWFLWKGWRNPMYRGGLGVRLAHGLEARQDHPVWLHAASVGEVRALATLLPLLHRAGCALLLTVGTPTGLAQARGLYRELMAPPQPGVRGLTVQSAPWDLPGAVRRFLRASQPQVGVFIETELWPNLIAGARGDGIPLGLISARLSERSLRRYRRWAARLMGDTVRAFEAIATQSEVDRERFIALGAAPAVVTVGGNLKAELEVAPEIHKLAAAWRARWATGRSLWVAGSTHAGEESICLAVQQRLLEAARAQGTSQPLLVLAPRHPERFGEVARLVAGASLVLARTSVPAAQPQSVEVLLVDEMGALLAWYAAADVAFVGGSLVPVGGHNLIEPALLSKPVLAGPHDFNAPQVAQRLAQAGGLIVVHDAEELAAHLAALLADPWRARVYGSRAHIGAVPEELGSRRALELVSQLLAARGR